MTGLPDPLADHAKFTLSGDDASAVIASLNDAGQSISSGIFFEDGILYAPPAMTAQVTSAVTNIATARKAALKAYAAAVRFSKETGGMTVNGHAYPTDRETQSKLTAAVVMSQVNTSATFQWKAEDGFVQLNAAGILAVAQAIGGYVQGCFAAEQAIAAAIDGGTITTKEQVDGYGWPPSS